MPISATNLEFEKESYVPIMFNFGQSNCVSFIIDKNEIEVLLKQYKKINMEVYGRNYHRYVAFGNKEDTNVNVEFYSYLNDKVYVILWTGYV